MENKKLISVSDINAYLYCARKLYLTKVCGLSTPPNRNMTIGKIKHNILESFSKSEEQFVSKFDQDFDRLELVFMYEDFIRNIAASVFFENRSMIEKFLIDKEDILKKVLRDFNEDIRLRIDAIKKSIAAGNFKENIWKNFDTLYISELKLESPKYGLKGRVDRILLNKKDNTIIPFELKSREDKIYHSDEIQLTAYAIMLEDHYNTKIPKGVVEVGNNKKEIDITAENINEILKISEEIRNLDQNPVPPMLSNFNKCKSCEFQHECMALKE